MKPTSQLNPQHHSRRFLLKSGATALFSFAIPPSSIAFQDKSLPTANGGSDPYAIPLLEYLDREHVTRRVGDERVGNQAACCDEHRGPEPSEPWAAHHERRRDRVGRPYQRSARKTRNQNR